MDDWLVLRDWCLQHGPDRWPGAGPVGADPTGKLPTAIVPYLPAADAPDEDLPYHPRGFMFAEFASGEYLGAEDEDDDEPSAAGWRYAYGQPGCLPDSDWYGPYDTRVLAVRAAMRAAIGEEA